MVPHEDPYLPKLTDLGIPAGKLGCSLEGAGKRRVFAIGNYVNQRLLWPVHQWVAEVLRFIWNIKMFQSNSPFAKACRMYGVFLF